jgi:hypothetical protein
VREKRRQSRDEGEERRSRDVREEHRRSTDLVVKVPIVIVQLGQGVMKKALSSLNLISLIIISESVSRRASTH